MCPDQGVQGSARRRFELQRLQKWDCLQALGEKWIPEVDWIRIHGTICPEEQVLSKTPSEVVEVDAGAIVSNLLTKSPSVFCLDIPKLFRDLCAMEVQTATCHAHFKHCKCILCDMKF